MKSCCLKCRKDTEKKNSRVSNTSFKTCNMWKQKNQDLSKIKKQKDY